MECQLNRFREEYLQLISQYTQEFRKLSKPVADSVLELLNKGVDINKAVPMALRENNFFGRNQDVLMSILFKAVACGFGVDPSSIAKPNEVKRILLYEAWAPDKMNLSQRLHGSSTEMRREIVDTISTAMRKQKAFKSIAMELYDGYNSGKRVINKAALPEYLKKMKDATKSIIRGGDKEAVEYQKALEGTIANIEKLSQRDAPTKALKAAYTQMLNAAKALNEKALENAVKTAIEEKSRYLAERIARTEISAAWGEAFFTKHKDDPDVVAYRWVLSSRHPYFDVCDLHANADFYGLGKGVYPKNKFPKRPAHPHCFCLIEPVYEGEIHTDFDKEADVLDNAKFSVKAGDEYLKNLSEHDQKRLLGTEGWRKWKTGEAWRKYLRQWEGYTNPTTRFNILDFGLQLFNSGNDATIKSNMRDKAEEIRRKIIANGLVWKPGSFEKHLNKRIKRKHLSADATPEDYINKIMAILKNKEAEIYLYHQDTFDQNYFVYGVPKWVVIVGENGIMESAFEIDHDYYKYLTQEKGYTKL